MDSVDLNAMFTSIFKEKKKTSFAEELVIIKECPDEYSVVYDKDDLTPGDIVGVYKLVGVKKVKKQSITDHLEDL